VIDRRREVARKDVFLDVKADLTLLGTNLSYDEQMNFQTNDTG